MKDDKQDSEKDFLENSYYHFVETLTVLGMDAAGQCAAMGNVNVAWELKDEGLDVDYLRRQTCMTFTEEQSNCMGELSRALHEIPDVLLVGSNDRSANIASLRHPSWDEVRRIAKQLLLLLESKTKENLEYFHSQKP